MTKLLHASFISSERENTLSGIFFENFVANELAAKEHKLFYWRGKSSDELEFVVESDNKLYPIDVKKGRGGLNSIENFSNHEETAHNTVLFRTIYCERSGGGNIEVIALS